MPLDFNELIGGYPVYPGHALTFAYLAIVKYGTAEAAIEPGKNYPNCVEDVDLPGAGCGAWGGSNALKKVDDGEPVDEIIEWCRTNWAHRTSPDLVCTHRERVLERGQTDSDQAPELIDSSYDSAMSPYRDHYDTDVKPLPVRTGMTIGKRMD